MAKLKNENDKIATHIMFQKQLHKKFKAYLKAHLALDKLLK